MLYVRFKYVIFNKFIWQKIFRYFPSSYSLIQDIFFIFMILTILFIFWCLNECLLYQFSFFQHYYEVVQEFYSRISFFFFLVDIIVTTRETTFLVLSRCSLFHFPSERNFRFIFHGLELLDILFLKPSQEYF